MGLTIDRDRLWSDLMEVGQIGFAAYVPCGMIFVPCQKGKSHSPDEWIEPQQATEGCQVLLRTVLELAEQKDILC